METLLRIGTSSSNAPKYFVFKSTWCLRKRKHHKGLLVFEYSKDRSDASNVYKNFKFEKRCRQNEIESGSGSFIQTVIQAELY